jgi:hypothetical protein
MAQSLRPHWPSMLPTSPPLLSPTTLLHILTYVGKPCYGLVFISKIFASLIQPTPQIKYILTLDFYIVLI